MSKEQILFDDREGSFCSLIPNTTPSHPSFPSESNWTSRGLIISPWAPRISLLVSVWKTERKKWYCKSACLRKVQFDECFFYYYYYLFRSLLRQYKTAVDYLLPLKVAWYCGHQKWILRDLPLVVVHAVQKEGVTDKQIVQGYISSLPVSCL